MGINILFTQANMFCDCKFWTFCREARSQSDGQLQRPLPSGSSPQPAMCGAMVLSCGKWSHTESDPTGRCPTRMWVTYHQCHHTASAGSKNMMASFQQHSTVFFLLAGDQSNRWGLPSSRPDGLSRGVAPAHAGLLGEGAQRQAKVWPDCHNLGQADQKPRRPQRAGQQLHMVSGTEIQFKMFITAHNHWLTFKKWLQQVNKHTFNPLNLWCILEDHMCFRCRVIFANDWARVGACGWTSLHISRKRFKVITMMLQTSIIDNFFHIPIWHCRHRAGI